MVKNHFNIAKEELALYGSESTSLQNLLAILIGPKANPEITGKLASLGVKKLSELSQADLLELEGVGELTAKRISAALGLTKHLMRSISVESVRSSKDAFELFSHMSINNEERLEVAFLNAKNQVISRKEIFRGGLSSCIVHPREIFREAIKQSAANIIVAHNHPSGNPTPSAEDIAVTKRIRDAGLMCGIELLDHIIVGANQKYISLAEKGYMKN